MDQHQLAWKPKLEHVISRNGKFLYLAGLIAMILNKIRRSIIEYSSPRPFSMNDIQRNVEYVLKVVNNWEKIAILYTGKPNPFENCSILELGPGPDLGTGIVLLSKGALRYHAIDLFPLAMNAPEIFYYTLFDELATYPFSENALRSFSEFSKHGKTANLNYQKIQYPLLKGVPQDQFDIIVSQAVWEHISAPEKTLISVKELAKKGALFINEVDLSCHTRFLRDIDPLNILCYGDQIYDALSFVGTPNRLRGSDYLNLSSKVGLQNAKIIPIRTLDNKYINSIRPRLSSKFREKEQNDLAILSCWWVATFPD